MSKKHEPGMAYDMEKLNKIFAFLSIIFLITTIWVFLDDYMRPWKKYQIEAMQVKRDSIEKNINIENEAIKGKNLGEMESLLKEANAVVASRKEDILATEDEIRLVKKEIQSETIVNGKLNSDVSAFTFNYEMYHAKNDRRAHGFLEKVHKNKKLFAESKDRMKTLQTKEKGLKKRLLDLNSNVVEAQRNIDAITGKRELLKSAKAKTDFDLIFAIRNAPFGDYLDPTLKIHQIVINDITDDRYFQHVPKVDRCITCHTLIDKPGFEKQANPHKTHPNLDLMLGKDSPHPLKKIGCTSCHGGEGHRVHDFNSIAHTPQNDKQRAEWIEKYNWHEPHKVPQIMYKKGYTEAACIKCHGGNQYIPQAKVLNEGRRNIEKFGCYGCHKMDGWEHKKKPGPSLLKIADKIDKEFFKNWVWDPKGFNKHAKMPSFFSQDNNKKPEFMKKNIAEVNAMAEFIWQKSKNYKPFMSYTGGNVEKGKELISSVGCMGCHGVEGLEKMSKTINAMKAPYLAGTGSKVTANWLVSWLIKPSHYQENTIMPSFRLSDREANDIAAYLLSLKNEKFKSKRFEPLDKGLRDEMLITYFSAFDTISVAKSKLAGMSDKERTHELGKRAVGKYGCYSCHNIEGFDGRSPIGPALTNVGSKPITQFGFGHEHDVEHSKDGWIKAHLLNPRRWDNGTDKPFKDILRMPNFTMTEAEATSITVALMGQVSDYIPMAGVKNMNANEAIVAEGMKVVSKFNCIGCHKIDGMYGDYTKLFEDDINEAPPRLNGQGHRVQSDWFYHFLGNVYPLRPWLKIRMPSFNMSADEKNKIVAMFQAKAGQKTFEDNQSKVVWKSGEKVAAKKLFKALDCASCHSTGFDKTIEPSAPDLTTAGRRLRLSWIKKWLRDPQKIMVDTMMPSFWEDNESQEPEILGGSVDRQIDALSKYIYEMSKDKPLTELR